MMIAGGMIWIAVMVAVLIALVLVLGSRRQQRTDQPEYFEKPKRDGSPRSHLSLGDDGELIEISDDDDDFDAEPKRKRDQ